MNTIIKRTMFFFLSSLIAIQTWAQEKGLDVNIDVNKNDNWYQQPWVWIVGGAVFIIILVALMKGSGNKD